MDSAVCIENRVSYAVKTYRHIRHGKAPVPVSSHAERRTHHRHRARRRTREAPCDIASLPSFGFSAAGPRRRPSIMRRWNITDRGVSGRITAQGHVDIHCQMRPAWLQDIPQRSAGLAAAVRAAGAIIGPRCHENASARLRK